MRSWAARRANSPRRLSHKPLRRTRPPAGCADGIDWRIAGVVRILAHDLHGLVIEDVLGIARKHPKHRVVFAAFFVDADHDFHLRHFHAHLREAVHFINREILAIAAMEFHELIRRVPNIAQTVALIDKPAINRAVHLIAGQRNALRRGRWDLLLA